MAASARALDDHPLLTARHVDALTDAVRAPAEGAAGTAAKNRRRTPR